LRKNFQPKTRKFIEECLASGITSPSEMRDAYQQKYGKELSDKAFTMALKRAGITKTQRQQIAAEAQKQTEVKDILDYEEVQRYIAQAEFARVKASTIDDMLKYIRIIWEWKGCTNPNTWTFEEIIECVKQRTPMKADDRGRMVFEQYGKVKWLFTALSAMFPKVLPKGWSSNLGREAGELKDYLTFEEYNEFANNLCGTPQMTREGWHSLFDAQANSGAREGVTGKTGILSLRWEDIDYTARRCSLREKGTRGKAGRIWRNVPLDLFPWLHGWEALMIWHQQRYGYIPTNQRHETGKAFPVRYSAYNTQFHETRKKCNGRIAGDLETMRPHVMRMTHAQWLVKMWVPIEQICGIFPDGWFGVGWDDPKVLLRFYITLETEQLEKAEATMKERMEKLELAPLSAWEKSNVRRQVAFNPCFEESKSFI